MKKKDKDFATKMIISIIWDILDFFIGRLPGFGTIFDIVGTALATKLWGNVGIIALWEVIDITDQLDAEIPTLTIIGVLAYLRDNKQLRR